MNVCSINIPPGLQLWNVNVEGLACRYEKNRLMKKDKQLWVIKREAFILNMNPICSRMCRHQFTWFTVWSDRGRKRGKKLDNREARIRSDQMIPASNRQFIPLWVQLKREVRRRHRKREPAQLQLDSQSVFPVKKPSKLVVWRLKSQFNFQPLPTAFQVPPSIYLFWINVISPPQSQRRAQEWSLGDKDGLCAQPVVHGSPRKVKPWIMYARSANLQFGR